MAESKAILERISRLAGALDQIEQRAKELYQELEAAILRENDITPGQTVVSNRFGAFLVTGVDNFSLEQELEEQPALVGHLDSKTQNQERVILPPWKILK